MHDDEGQATPQGISFATNPSCRLESEFIECFTRSTWRKQEGSSHFEPKPSFLYEKLVICLCCPRISCACCVLVSCTLVVCDMLCERSSNFSRRHSPFQ